MATDRLPFTFGTAATAEPRRRATLTRIAGACTIGSAALMVGQWGAAAPSAVDLRIDAIGFRRPRGHAEAKLFRKGENVLREPWKRLRALPQDGRASFAFSDLPSGEYAVVVFHDENDNGKIDHNFLGLPSEPLGFSNGFVPGLIAGMPSFEKLKFALTVGHKPLRIEVK